MKGYDRLFEYLVIFSFSGFPNLSNLQIFFASTSEVTKNLTKIFRGFTDHDSEFSCQLFFFEFVVVIL